MTKPNRPAQSSPRGRSSLKKRVPTHVSDTRSSACPSTSKGRQGSRRGQTSPSALDAEAELPQRRAPSQQRSRATVEALLRAAALLLAEVGYAKASTNAIAARAGVSIGSLYQYFNDKDAIYLALLAEHGREMKEIVGKHLAKMDDPRVDLLGALQGLMNELVELHEADPEVLAVLERELAPLEARHEGGPHADFDQLVLRVEEQLVARGARRSKATRSGAWLLGTTVAFVARRVVHDASHRVDRRATIRNTLAMVEGLLAELGISSTTHPSR